MVGFANYLSEDTELMDLTMIEGSAESRDPTAIEFLEGSGLPTSAVVLALLDQSDDCIKILSPDGRLQFMNCAGRQVMEIDDFAAFEDREWSSLWPEETSRLVAKSVAEARKGKMSRFEAFCPTAKGSPRWWEVTVSPIKSPRGHVVAILSSSRDITSRRDGETAASAVVTEMKHRLRNAYTVSSAISSATGREFPEGKEVAAQIAARLARLADVQTTLIDAGHVTLNELVVRTVDAFDASGTANLEELPQVQLGENAARALALVFGELATNSLKYGALSGRGTLDISGSRDGELVTITWEEHHVAPSDTSSVPSSGVGRGIMHTMLAAVRGDFKSEASEQGYRATVSLRVSVAA